MNTAVIGEVRPMTTEELVRVLYGMSVDEFAVHIKSESRFHHLFKKVDEMVEKEASK